MPPITQWNPILQRLYEKTPEIIIDRQFVEIAKELKVTKHNLSKWIRGGTMHQDNIEVIARYMVKRGYSPQDIVYVLTGEGMTETGAYRTLNHINDMSNDDVE